MSKKKIFNLDNWLEQNLQRLVDTCPGTYIVVADGEIYKDGTPAQLRDKAKTEHPNAKLLGMRVPYPRDFICALIVL